MRLRPVHALPVAVKTVLAKLLAMVGRDDDQRIVEHPVLLERGEEAAELLIECGEAIVVGIADEGDVTLRNVLRLTRLVPGPDQLHVGRRLGLQAEVAIEAGRGQVGVVSVDVVEEGEERPFPPIRPRARRGNRG